MTIDSEPNKDPDKWFNIVNKYINEPGISREERNRRKGLNLAWSYSMDLDKFKEKMNENK